MNQSVANPLPSKLASRFRVIRPLGQGGLSCVYLVEDLKNLGIPLALKLLNPNKLDSSNLDRFRKEFEVLTAIKHPNLIEAFELIEDGDSIGYLMEAVEGNNLLEILRLKKLNHYEIDLIFSQILAALFELHKHELAHRDIKLENILIRTDGFVKLSDLGLMKKVIGVGQAADTEVGILLGTSQYLPPEYIKHSIYNFRSDIYATGLMLFECLAGKRWLEGKQGRNAINYLTDMNYEFPKLALAGLPYKYQNILGMALAVQPRKRYSSAEEMRQAILSESGSLTTIRTVEVSENIDIRDVRNKRKTAEFLSLRETRRKIFIGLAGACGAVALTAILGFPADDSKKTHPPQRMSAPFLSGTDKQSVFNSSGSKSAQALKKPKKLLEADSKN